MFVDKPLSEMALNFDACNHVLHTLLAKLFRNYLGYSELVLRLPSLLGCALYFWAVYRLVQEYIGDAYLQFAAIAALTLNPAILDFCVASRGYGLALALLLWSVYWTLRAIREDGHPRYLRRAGIVSGLCISASLTCAVPLAALCLMLLVVAVYKGFWRRMDQFIGPAVVVSFVLLILPLARADRGAFYVGHPSWAASLNEFFEGSFRYSLSRFVLNPPQALFWVSVAIVLIAAALASFRRRGTSGLALGIVGGVLCVSLAALTVLHLVGGMPLPVLRTGLYLIPLLTLGLALAFELSRPTAFAGTVLLAGLSVVYVAQMDVRYFADWRFDASTKWLMKKLDEDYRGRKLDRPVELGVTWLVHPTANFYRKRNHMDWLPEVKRMDDLSGTNFEYYLLTQQDLPLVDKFHLKILFRDALSGTLLAART